MQRLQLRLVERVCEERVCGVVRCKALFEQEQVINIVEDAMQVRAQQTRRHEARILAQVRRAPLAHHSFKVLRIQCPNILRCDRGQSESVPIWHAVEAVAHPSDLEQESDVRVHSLLLEQEVVSLLEVLERQVILRYLTQAHDEFTGDAELDATSQSFFMSLEYHVH